MITGAAGVGLSAYMVVMTNCHVSIYTFPHVGGNLRESHISTMINQRWTYHWLSNKISYLKHHRFLFIVDLISSFLKDKLKFRIF